MSVNRSVQAAQRRRAGPSNNEPPIPGRTPQPSINSAQMFANQARSGPGPNIPTGRLAGQQEAMQQAQMQQQMAQGQNQGNDKLSSVSKMTIPQAITLITLRLGAVESKLLHMPESSNMNIGGESGVDSAVLQSITSRLESLEKRSNSTSGNTSTPELNLVKQQLETLKQAVIQSKGSTTNLIKENILLKTQAEELKKELLETKELLESLQKITLENTQNIFNLSVTYTDDYNGEFNEENIVNDLENTELQIDELNENLLFDNDQNDIIGTDLKKMIESELSLDM